MSHINRVVTFLKSISKMNSDKGNGNTCNDRSDLTNLEGNGLVLSSYFIPEEVIAYILSFLDAHSLVSNCRLVCKQWQTIVDNIVWKLKIRNSRVKCLAKLSDAEKSRLKLSWVDCFSMFSKNPFSRNLLRNNCGQLKFRYWTDPHKKVMPRSDWIVESSPAGADPVPDVDDFESNRCCFATTYTLCEKSQLVHLQTCGIPDSIMDVAQPSIEVSEWFAGRFDCGCVYRLRVSLLDENQHVLAESEPISEIIEQWHGKEWHKVSTSFENYGPGVRYILFYHAGKDTQFWAGHYGSKMAGGVIRIS